MTRSQPQTGPNQSKLAANDSFGQRLKGVLEQIAAQRSIKRTDLEERIATNAEFSQPRFRRWYKDTNFPDVETFRKLFLELEGHADHALDFEYLLLGRSADNSPDKTIQNLGHKLDHIHATVQEMYSHVRDDALGVESVIMKMSIRMLEDIRASNDVRLNKYRDNDDLEPAIAGYLPDDLFQIVEECSKLTRIATLRFDYEMQSENDSRRKNPQESDLMNRELKPGRFFYVVAENLRRGHQYEFILPKTKGNGAKIKRDVSQFRDALISHDKGHVSHAKMKNLQFFTTTLPLPASFMVMDIDFKGLLKRRPFLANELEDDYMIKGDKTHRLGKVISPSIKTHGGALMDPNRIRDAMYAWKLYVGSRVGPL